MEIYTSRNTTFSGIIDATLLIIEGNNIELIVVAIGIDY